MIEQDLAFIGAAPAVKVLLLAGLSPDPTPDHAVAHAEFAGQLRPHGWMTKRVGRVENVISAAEPVGVYLSQQQVSDQRLAGRNQLIRQHVPGSHLKPARAHQVTDSLLLVGTYPEIVLQEDRLAVEQECGVGLRFEALNQVIEGRNEPRQKDALREIPFPVPVGMRDQMEGVPWHAQKPSPGRLGWRGSQAQ